VSQDLTYVLCLNPAVYVLCRIKWSQPSRLCLSLDRCRSAQHVNRPQRCSEVVLRLFDLLYNSATAYFIYLRQACLPIPAYTDVYDTFLLLLTKIYILYELPEYFAIRFKTVNNYIAVRSQHGAMKEATESLRAQINSHSKLATLRS
jgi:hypothetical protein